MNIYQLRKPPEKEKEPYKQRDMYKIDKDLIQRAFEGSFEIKDEQIEPAIAKERLEMQEKFQQMAESF